MKRKSHTYLGILLANHYLPNISKLQKRMFLYGCIQPDQNPGTYLKGTLRHQHFRGHNYQNAERFVQRIARRLERRKHFHLWDYYTLGKLIHYTVDGFTFAHNTAFSPDLKNHRAYELLLQDYFLSHAALFSFPNSIPSSNCGEILRWLHRIYITMPGSPEGDSHFAFLASCCVLGQMNRICHGISY